VPYVFDTIHLIDRQLGVRAGEVDVAEPAALEFHLEQLER